MMIMSIYQLVVSVLVLGLVHLSTITQAFQILNNVPSTQQRQIVRSSMSLTSTSTSSTVRYSVATGTESSSTTTESTELTTSLDEKKKKLDIQFSKYHGLGNDFILIDDRDKIEPSLTPDQAATLCHRNFGIGADGVIFALQPPKTDDTNNNSKYDFTMRIYNSDGSEPEMCGNGIRCFAQFLHDLQLSEQGQEKEVIEEEQKRYIVNTLAGTIIPVLNDDGTITVDMGEPIFNVNTIPTTLQPNYDDGTSVVSQTMIDPNGKVWTDVSTVSMGNPHVIIFVNDFNTDVQFTIDGPVIESDTKQFPAKVNVEFVQVLDQSHVQMNVWERGAGPTLACGTGACAVAIAAIRSGKVNTNTSNKNTPVRVSLPGGDLLIQWDADTTNKVYMTGPAQFVFSGTTQI